MGKKRQFIQCIKLKMQIDIKNVRWLKQKQGANSLSQSAALKYSLIKWDPIAYSFLFALCLKLIIY